MLSQLLTGSCMGTAFFIIYLEVNPRIKDVWYRKNDKGEYEIRLNNVKEYYKAPLMDNIFWYPCFWDINPYIFTITTTVVYTTIHKLIY